MRLERKEKKSKMEIIADKPIIAWKKTLQAIMDKGVDFIDRDKRVCRELLNLLLIIKSSDDIEDPVDVMKGFKDFVYPSKEEIGNVVLDKNGSSGYGYNYGQRLFNYKNAKNQIDNFILPLLKSNPSSRRAVAMIYDPLTDSEKNKKTIPALLNVHFKIFNGNLDISVVIRSNDFFIGWPANIIQINLLQKYLAEKLKLPTGKITIFSNSAHVFQEHFDKINKIIEKQ